MLRRIPIGLPARTLATLAACCGTLAAQEPAAASRSDSLAAARGYTPTVHVTAPRLEAQAAPPGAPPQALGAGDIAALPALHSGQLLHHLPGLYLYDTTGSGSRFALAARGFSPTGLGEHVELRLDGIPVNELQTGRPDFDLLPPAQLGRIEVLPGPASARLGESATAGIVHLVSQPRVAPWLSSRLGSDGQIGIESGAGVQRSRGYAGASAGWMRATGWRDNSDWEDRRLFARGALRLGADRILGASALVSRHERGEPGPVPRDRLAARPESAFFPRDGEEVDRVLAGLRLVGSRDGPVQHAERAWVRARSAALVRSLAAGRDAVEERREKRDEISLGGELQGTVRVAAGRQSLHFGLELERGALDDLDHADSDSTAAARAHLRRTLAAPWLQSVTALPGDVVLALGARWDAYRLRFDQTAGGTARARRRFERWSPRAALAWRRGALGASVAASGVFGIPTLDQLYDLRHPFGLPLSNPDLRAQHGTSLELGLHWERDRTAADLVVYRLRMHDEITFDAARFVYANVDRSDHDGVEVGVRRRWSDRLETAASWTWTDAVFRSGALNGNRVHGLPEHRGGLRLGIGLPLRLGLALTLEAAGEQMLDETNRHRLRGYTTTSARLRRAFRHVDVWAQADNLFDQRHAVSGSVLPFDATELLYPAAARRIAVGIDVRR